MAGGILQIIAYGAQDVYLTNNPQITFFKVVYRRHTNFSIEVYEHTFLDGPNFGTKNMLTLPRNGDLATRMYLKIIVDSVTPNEGSRFAWIRRLGHAILESIEVEMGGVVIDKQTGTWLDIWYELARSDKHERGYLKMIGDTPEMTNFDSVTKPQYELFIPLRFWFNRHIGTALPLVAIQYHEIIFRIRINDVRRLIVTDSQFNNFGDFRILDVALLVDYVYLDKEERRRFAYVGHEYLIEQVQYTGEEPADLDKRRTKLHFNFPTKELIWAMRNGNYTINKKFLCYTNDDNWPKAIRRCAEEILENSILLLRGPIFEIDMYGNTVIITPGEDPPEEGTWEEFIPGSGSSSETRTSNGNINVVNNNKTMSLWINTSSLRVDDYNITGKISGNITVLEDETIILQDINSTITIRDISIPVELMTDTRVRSNDICLNQFSNYGVLIDGSANPIEFSRLEFNNQDRFEKRGGKFFNYLQPELHHSNTPKDGINCYSFSITPEAHQPSGSANLSKIENIIFSIWITDITKKEGLPELNLLNLDNRLYIFAFSYNVLRVVNGLTGLSYSG